MMAMQMVSVRWIDSTSYTGWMSADAARRYASEPLTVHQTIGFLVDQTTEAICIAQSASADGELIGEMIAIPRAVVVGVRELIDGANMPVWVRREKDDAQA